MFKIIVKRIDVIVPHGANEENKDEQTKEIEKEIYSQTVEKLDITKLIKIVNNFFTY